MKRMRRWGVALVGASAALAVLPLVAIEIAARAMRPPDISRFEKLSQIVTDEDGQLLHAYLSADGYLRLPTAAPDLKQEHLNLILAVEDARFFSHPGYDVLALGRAILDAVMHGRARSGASTITMQLCRLLGWRDRSLSGKVVQVLMARAMELRYSKDQILTMYLTLAPFGANIEGVRAASLTYFGRKPIELDVAEIATLVALPQAPERRRPDRFNTHAIAAGQRILGQHIRRPQAEARVSPAARRSPLTLARHLADRLHTMSPSAKEIRTLVDRDLQERIEALAASSAKSLAPQASIAVVVVRNRDLAVRAWTGGIDYLDATRAGSMDLARAYRSPGSTLKPIIYGLAFDRLIVHPETVVTDVPRAYGDYEPSNFTLGFDGDVTIRKALVRSVNTVAVSVLQQLGPAQLLASLKNAGIIYHVPGLAHRAGLAIGLGGGGISLESLTKLYASFPNGGAVRDLRFVADEPLSQPRYLMGKPAAWAVRDILSEMPEPEGYVTRRSQDGQRRLAYKTGTSYGFRDSWAVGFDSDHTVGIWIGRPDSNPNDELTGAKGAAPLLFRTFDLLPIPSVGVGGERPQNSILADWRELPPRLQRLAPPLHSESSFRISFPRDGASLDIAELGSRGYKLPFSISGGVPPYRWIIGGTLSSEASNERQFQWPVVGEGAVTARVIDARGATAETAFWLTDTRKSTTPR